MTTTPERVAFFDGQRLAAQDLEGLERFHREMRELHNRSLHQPGIGQGLAVEGAQGDREITIGPGYALDDRGREIVLVHDHVEAVPPVEGDPGGLPAVFDLTVSADEDPELVETRDGVCAPRGPVRLREEPVVCWVRLERGQDGTLHSRDPVLGAEIQSMRRLALARVEVRSCALHALHLATRRPARPPSQPYVACGRQRAVAWNVTALPELSPFPYLLVASISTATADFVTTPCYTARVQGPRTLRVQAPNAAVFDVVADGLPSIGDPRPDGFVLTFMTMVSGPAPAPDSLELAVRREWSVVWMGVE